MRDLAGNRRDKAAHRRDDFAEQRDRDAERRDQAAEHAEASETLDGAANATDARNRFVGARAKAAADRRRASRDRRSGASERSHAELDRNTALADRGSGASERTQAELDRSFAQADRGASARERKSAGLDDLTGAYLRGAGFQELEREIARARRTQQTLVLAFVDIDGLKSINDARGHAAGDRMLIEAADTLRAILRSYDLIIRYGGDEFVCTLTGVEIADAASRFALVNPALAAAPEHGSVTVGLAELRAIDTTLDLVRRADAALYRERAQHRVG